MRSSTSLECAQIIWRTTTGTGTTAATGTTAQSGTAEEDETVLSSDFETFLTMLTVQLENQDPLNPVASEDFAMQLATFSGVEQQVKTNKLLELLGDSLSSLGMGQVAGWVGMEARVTSAAAFDGSPITLYPTARASADKAELVVRNASGDEVQRVEINVSSDPIDWTGETEDGGTLSAGTYTFEVESYSGDELLATDEVAHYTEIVEARMTGEGAQLVTASGEVVAASEVTGLRSAQASE